MSDRGATRRREDPYGAESPRRRTLSRVLQLLFLLVIVAACGLAALMLYSHWRNSMQGSVVQVEGGNPNLGVGERFYLESYLSAHATDLERPAGTTDQPVTFVVSAGESANQIAGNLTAAGLLEEGELFINYVRYYGLDATLTAGTVQVEPGLTIPELAALLSNPYQRIELSFLPGWRIEEMAAYLDATRPAQIDPQEFLAIAQRVQGFDLAPYRFLVEHPAGASLEGFLHPGSYEIAVEATAADLIGMMLARFDERVTPSMRQAFGAEGLGLRDAVTLASIVERETPLDAEKPLIAGVFMNRLSLGMPLQADSTVQYALGYDPEHGGWWKSPLSASDLQVSSRFNTYQIDGLPPGPIANPGLVSLQAVAGPEESDFLFFVLDCATQNGHLFSVTYEEHVANVQRCPAP